ncbi:hypothetical protein ACFPES_07730 [Paenibacillus sp. GCM10023248]|uniref:hypothetical protein n=1 Tax=unclassified Paenibacillus TaxID=185978 RepID=UPI002378F16D|nr:hypothetical protein [Paenibacillus sp. MAHUQ-63]MDD9266922.1 hypothetical protein [Paenibacillus sp. MAHUQ-63]
MRTQLKRRVSQATLLAFMLTTAFGAVSASAADESASETKPTAAPAAAITEGKPVLVKTVAAAHIGSGLLFQPAHERNYLKLLAGAYAPDSLDAWKQALEDRKQAESELPKPTLTIGGPIPSTKAGEAVAAPMNPAETKTFTLKAAPAAVPDGEAPSSAPRVKKIIISKDGSGESTKLIQAIPLEGAPVSGDIMESMQFEPVPLPESFVRQQKLTEAVEADDAAAIQSLLPQLLEDYKKETDNIRSLAKKLKDQATKAEE